MHTTGSPCWPLLRCWEARWQRRGFVSILGCTPDSIFMRAHGLLCPMGFFDVFFLLLVGLTPFVLLWAWLRNPEKSREQILRFTFSMATYTLGILLFGDFLTQWGTPAWLETLISGLMTVFLLLAVYFFWKIRATSTP